AKAGPPGRKSRTGNCRSRVAECSSQAWGTRLYNSWRGKNNLRETTTNDRSADGGCHQGTSAPNYVPKYRSKVLLANRGRYFPEGPQGHGRVHRRGLR